MMKNKLETNKSKLEASKTKTSKLKPETSTTKHETSKLKFETSTTRHGASKPKLTLASALTAAAVVFAMLIGCSPQQQNSTGADTGAQSTTSTTQQEANSGQISVSVSLTSPAGDGKISYDNTVSMQAGSTALDALEQTGLTLDVQDSQYGKFVNSVGELATEGSKGWIYTVNDEQIQVSADKQELKDGDRLVWSYIDMAG